MGLAILWATGGGPARAQSGPGGARAQVAQLLAQAGENIDLGDYDEAIAGLARALGIIRQAQLASDPMATRVEVALGVALVGAGHRSDAVAHFRAAVRLNPSSQVERRWASAPVMSAFGEARGAAPRIAGPPPPPHQPPEADETMPMEPRAKAPAAPARPASAAAAPGKTKSAPAPVAAAAAAAPPDPPAAPAAAPAPPEDDNAPVVGVRARALSAAEVGKPLAIQVRIGSDVGSPSRVVLLYRAPGGGKFAELPMAADKAAGSYKASIPAQSVRAPAIQYYVEARDAKNRPLARRGNPDRPLVQGVAEPPPPPVAAPARKRRAPAAARPPEAPPPAATTSPPPAATPAAKPAKHTKLGEDDENPFDSEHDPTKVVPQAPR
ncbi:MAG TPA: tetratricopeptide repeat protein [Polyangia bacterium]|nr:tetratricopeptide repeat protein [Polyangia bacterium]